MRDLSVWRSRRWLPWLALGVLVATLITPAVVAAAVDPPPDPAGIATGDKSAVVDAGGNAFVVTEPTDKADPEYAVKMKAFDDYQGAGRQRTACDQVGRLGRTRQDCDQHGVDAEHRVPRAVHAGRLRPPDLRAGA